MRIISLNTNGIRSASKKGLFDWLGKQKTDFLCIQETKCQRGDLDETFFPKGWHVRLSDAILDKLGAKEFDDEGRYVEMRFGKLSVVSLYLPSGSSGPERQASKDRFLKFFLPVLKKWQASGRDYVVCGDWNIAHQNIDLKNWKSNQKNSGFLPHERAWLDELFAAGWVDGYRSLHPKTEGEAYTWWSQRGAAYAKNVGWRIDYQMLTPGLKGKVKAAVVQREARLSDHAPLVMDYRL